MNDREFQEKLGELIRRIGEVPESQRPALEQLAADTRARHDRMRKMIGELQESLDYLRLSVKYLVFDLEATRRENKYLRSLIEAQAESEAEAEDEIE